MGIRNGLKERQGCIDPSCCGPLALSVNLMHFMGRGEIADVVFPELTSLSEQANKS